MLINEIHPKREPPSELDFVSNQPREARTEAVLPGQQNQAGFLQVTLAT